MLGVVVASLWFAAIAFGGVDLWARVVLQWLMVLGLVFFAVRLAVARRPKLVLPPAFWAATLFMAYAVGRYWYADVEYVARQELIRVGICYLVFVMVTTSLSGQRSVKVLVYALIFLATLEAAYGIYQWSAKPGTVLGYQQHAAYVTRGSGTLFNPNHLAGLIGLALPMALALAMFSKEPHWMRILVAYAAGVMALGIFATLSRGGVVAAAVALVLLGGVTVWAIRKRWVVVAGLLLLVLLGVFAAKMPDSLRQRFSEVRTQLTPDGRSGRQLIWDAALMVWKEEPWFGSGPDHFDQKFRRYRDLWLQTRPRRAHNDYLQLLADWGVAGAIGVILFVGALAWGLWRTWPHLVRDGTTLNPSPNSSRLAFVVGAGCGLAAVAAQSVVEFGFFIPAYSLGTAVALAIVAGSFRYSRSTEGASSGLVWRVLGGSLAVLAGTVLVRSAGTGSAEAYCLAKANRAGQGSGQGAEWLQKAIEAEPSNPETHYVLGENLRMRSFEGVDGHEALALESLEHFTAASRLFPSDPYPWARMAMGLDWLGRHDEAGEMMSKALALDPENKSIVTLMGWHLMQVGKLDEAYLHLDRARNKMPHEPDPLSGILLEQLVGMVSSPLRQLRKGSAP